MSGATNKITALYCRLSQEDARLGESLSIENQKAILLEWQTFPNAAAADEALNTEPAPEPAGNFHITDDHLGEGGAKQKYARNIEAIRTLLQLEQEHRGATVEEQQVLSQYVGWGGLADAFDPDKDNWAKEYQSVLRAELSYPVSLGDDARGNITRLDNAIDNFADRIADAENALQNLEQQKRAAEVEVAKPFAQEEELAEKSARLAELNALLNIDRSSAQDSPEKTEETPTTRPSVLAALGEKSNQPEPVKPFRSYYDKDGDAR